MNKMIRFLINVNIFLNCLILVLCIYWTFTGKTVEAWILGLWVFTVLAYNIEKKLSVENKDDN